MKKIINIPMLDNTGGALHEIVLEAVSAGAVSTNDNNEAFELTFEKAADAKAFEDRLFKLFPPSLVKNDPVDDPDQPSE